MNLPAGNDKASKCRVHSQVWNLATLLKNQPGLSYRGRYVSLDQLLQVDDTQYLICFRDGLITNIHPVERPLPQWTFAIRGSRDGWDRFWQPIPKPGFHDLFALSKAGVFSIEGNLQPFMANLQFFKEVMALPRSCYVGDDQ